MDWSQFKIIKAYRRQIFTSCQRLTFNAIKFWKAVMVNV